MTKIIKKYLILISKQDYKNYTRFKRGYFDHVNDSEIGVAFENGEKGVIAIGLNDIDNDDIIDKDKKADKASSLNHEEIAHGLDVLLNGKQTKSTEEGHKFYYGVEDYNSPSNEEVLKDKKYNGTIAKEQLLEIYKIIDNNEDKNKKR